MVYRCTYVLYIVHKVILDRSANHYQDGNQSCKHNECLEEICVDDRLDASLVWYRINDDFMMAGSSENQINVR